MVCTQQLCLQERQRQGILGIHMDSLKEHLDKQEMQKLFGEIVHRKGYQLDGPALDLQVLTTVVLSRYLLLLSACLISCVELNPCMTNGPCHVFRQAMQDKACNWIILDL